MSDNIKFEQNIKDQISNTGAPIQNIQTHHINQYFGHQQPIERNASAVEGAGANMTQAAPAIGSENDNLLKQLKNLNATRAHDILRKNLMYLCKQIDLNTGLLTQLKELGGIGDVPMQAIEQGEPTDFKRNQALIDFIRKGDMDRFIKFIDALIATEQEHIALTLAKSLNA